MASPNVDFVLRTLRPLRPCDPRNDVFASEKSKQKYTQKSPKIWRELQKISPGNTKDFTGKSKNFTKKSKKVYQDIYKKHKNPKYFTQKFCPNKVFFSSENFFSELVVKKSSELFKNNCWNFLFINLELSLFWFLDFFGCFDTSESMIPLLVPKISRFFVTESSAGIAYSCRWM